MASIHGQCSTVFGTSVPSTSCSSLSPSSWETYISSLAYSYVRLVTDENLEP